MGTSRHGRPPFPSEKRLPVLESVRKGARTVLEILDEDENELASELQTFERGRGTGAGAEWLGRKGWR